MTQEAALLPIAISPDHGFGLVKIPAGATAEAGSVPFKELLSGELNPSATEPAPTGSDVQPNLMSATLSQPLPGQALPPVGTPLPLIAAASPAAADVGEMLPETLPVLSGEVPFSASNGSREPGVQDLTEHDMPASGLLQLIAPSGPTPGVSTDAVAVAASELPPIEDAARIATAAAGTAPATPVLTPATATGLMDSADTREAVANAVSAQMQTQAPQPLESSKIPQPVPHQPGELSSNTPAPPNASGTAQPDSKDEPPRFAAVAQAVAQAQQHAPDTGKTARADMATSVDDGAGITSIETKPIALPQAHTLGNHGAPAGQSAQAAGLNSALPMPLHHERWSEGLGQRLVLMVNHKIMEADVKLNPQHLGPLEIRIALNNDQASINFSTHHGAVKDVIEAALPRLREMLAENGIQLADANVSDQQRRQYGNEAQSQINPAAGYQEVHETVDTQGSEVVKALLKAGVVDYYV
ncbi:MAG: flagellar hook-length control protein FliK [Pseudomonadota bacterium]